MSPRRLFLRVLPSIATSLCLGVAAAATTTPLGIYAVKIKGAASGEEPARTYLGLPLLQSPIFVGPAGTISGTSLSFQDAGSLPYEAGKEYFVQVLSGPGAGFVSGIIAGNPASVTCEKDLSPWMAPGVLFSIRPNHRLNDLFGADNRFGFESGSNAEQSDKIVIWDSAAQDEKVYYFNSTRNRWEEKEAEADAGSTPVRYPNGLYIVRRSAAPMRIALKGEISEAPVLLPVRDGGNVFSLPVNLSASLANLVSSEGLFAVASGKNAAQADLLSFEDPVGVADRGPFYYRNRNNDSGWRSVGKNDSQEPLLPLDPLSTLVMRHRGEEYHVRLNANLEAPPGGPYVPPADPEAGELPLQVELKVPIVRPELVCTIETSIDLASWASVAVVLPEADGRIPFTLPPGQSRAFYRIRVEEF